MTKPAPKPPAKGEPLRARRCQPCEGGVKPLTREQAQRGLGQLKGGWRLHRDGRSIARAFKFKDFYRTMSFVNALAHIANIEDHHPDLEVGYNHCHVRYTTDAIGGLSDNDFICAAKIDALPLV